MDKDKILSILETAKDKNGEVPMKLVRQAFDKLQEQNWIPCSERFPEEKINRNTQDYDWVLCSTTFGDVRAYHFGRGRFLHGCGDVTQYVIAWQPLPEPYQGERKGADDD